MAELEPLKLRFSVDDSPVKKALRDIEYKASQDFTLTPKVDHKPLTELNKHFDLKLKDHKSLQRYFDKNPLTVKYQEKFISGSSSRARAGGQDDLKAVRRQLESMPIQIGKEVNRVIGGKLDAIADKLGQSILSQGLTTGLASGYFTNRLQQNKPQQSDSDISRQLGQALQKIISQLDSRQIQPDIDFSGLEGLGEQVASDLMGKLQNEIAQLSLDSTQYNQLFSDIVSIFERNLRDGVQGQDFTLELGDLSNLGRQISSEIYTRVLREIGNLEIGGLENLGESISDSIQQQLVDSINTQLQGVDLSGLSGLGQEIKNAILSNLSGSELDGLGEDISSQLQQKITEQINQINLEGIQSQQAQQPVSEKQRQIQEFAQRYDDQQKQQELREKAAKVYEQEIHAATRRRDTLNRRLGLEPKNNSEETIRQTASQKRQRVQQEIDAERGKQNPDYQRITELERFRDSLTGTVDSLIKAQDKLRSLFSDPLKKELTPKDAKQPRFYRELIQMVAGYIPDDPPEIIVDEEALRKAGGERGAKATYDPLSNVIRVKEEYKQALEGFYESGQDFSEWLKRIKTIIHELTHATDFDFGSLGGISRRTQNPPSTYGFGSPMIFPEEMYRQLEEDFLYLYDRMGKSQNKPVEARAEGTARQLRDKIEQFYRGDSEQSAQSSSQQFTSLLALTSSIDDNVFAILQLLRGSQPPPTGQFTPNQPQPAPPTGEEGGRETTTGSTPPPPPPPASTKSGKIASDFIISGEGFSQESYEQAKNTIAKIRENFKQFFHRIVEAQENKQQQEFVNLKAQLDKVYQEAYYQRLENIKKQINKAVPATEQEGQLIDEVLQGVKQARSQLTKEKNRAEQRRLEFIRTEKKAGRDVSALENPPQLESFESLKPEDSKSVGDDLSESIKEVINSITSQSVKKSVRQSLEESFKNLINSIANSQKLKTEITNAISDAINGYVNGIPETGNETIDKYAKIAQENERQRLAEQKAMQGLDETRIQKSQQFQKAASTLGFGETASYNELEAEDIEAAREDMLQQIKERYEKEVESLKQQGYSEKSSKVKEAQFKQFAQEEEIEEAFDQVMGLRSEIEQAINDMKSLPYPNFKEKTGLYRKLVETVMGYMPDEKDMPRITSDPNLAEAARWGEYDPVSNTLVVRDSMLKALEGFRKSGQEFENWLGNISTVIHELTHARQYGLGSGAGFTAAKQGQMLPEGANLFPKALYDRIESFLNSYPRRNHDLEAGAQINALEITEQLKKLYETAISSQPIQNQAQGLLGGNGSGGHLGTGIEQILDYLDDILAVLKREESESGVDVEQSYKDNPEMWGHLGNPEDDDPNDYIVPQKMPQKAIPNSDPLQSDPWEGRDFTGREDLTAKELEQIKKQYRKAFGELLDPILEVTDPATQRKLINEARQNLNRSVQNLTRIPFDQLLTTEEMSQARTQAREWRHSSPLGEESDVAMSRAEQQKSREERQLNARIASLRQSSQILRRNPNFSNSDVAKRFAQQLNEIVGGYIEKISEAVSRETRNAIDEEGQRSANFDFINEVGQKFERDAQQFTNQNWWQTLQETIDDFIQSAQFVLQELISRFQRLGTDNAPAPSDYGTTFNDSIDPDQTLNQATEETQKQAESHLNWLQRLGQTVKQYHEQQVEEVKEFVRKIRERLNRDSQDNYISEFDEPSPYEFIETSPPTQSGSSTLDQGRDTLNQSRETLEQSRETLEQPIEPNVDDQQLTDLNRHFEVKEDDYDALRNHYGNNPIEPQMDTDQVDSKFEALLDQAKEFGFSLLAFMGIDSAADALAQAVAEASQIAARFEQQSIALEFASTLKEPQQIINDVKQDAEELGINFLNALEGYKELSAAMVNTPLEIQAPDIFRGVQEGIASRAATVEQQEAVFTAVQQIAAKNRVSLEELNRQLGQALPGALQTAARAMGMTSEELINLVEKGNLFATEFLPQFSSQLRKEAVATLTEATNTISAKFERLRNSYQEFLIALGGQINQTIEKAITPLKTILGFLTENLSAVTSIAGAVATVLGVKLLNAITPINTQFLILRTRLREISVQFGMARTAGQKFAVSLRTIRATLKGVRTALLSLGKAVAPLVALTAAFEAFDYFTSSKLADNIDAATSSVEAYNSELKQLKDNLESAASAQEQWIKQSEAQNNLLIQTLDKLVNRGSIFGFINSLRGEDQLKPITEQFANNELKQNFEAIEESVNQVGDSIQRVREVTKNAFSGSTPAMERFRDKIKDSDNSVSDLNEGFQQLFRGNQVSADQYNEILNNITREIQAVNNELRDNPSEERASELEKQLSLLQQQKQVMTEQVRGVRELEQQLSNLQSFEEFILKYRSLFEQLVGQEEVKSLLSDINAESNALQGEIDAINKLLKDTLDRISEIEQTLDKADFRLEIKGNFADIDTAIQKLAVWRRVEQGDLTEAEAQIQLGEIEKQRDITGIDQLETQLETYKETLRNASESVKKQVQQLAFDVPASQNTGIDLTKLLTEEYEDALIEFARKVESQEFDVSTEAEQVYRAINRILQLRQEIPNLKSEVIQTDQNLEQQREDLKEELEETNEATLNFSDSLINFIRDMRQQIQDAELDLKEIQAENKAQKLRNDLQSQLKAGSDSLYQGFVDLVSQFVDAMEEAKLNTIDQNRQDTQLSRELSDNLRRVTEIRREALQEDTFVISNQIKNAQSLIRSQTPNEEGELPSNLNYEIGSYRNYARYKPNPDATVEGLLPHHSGQDAHDFILNRGANVPIPTPVGGKVTFAGYGGNRAGNMVKLATEFGEVMMAHFKNLQVRTGQEIQAGQILGIQGTTGRSSGVHVHYEGSDQYLQALFDLVSGKTPVSQLPTPNEVQQQDRLPTFSQSQQGMSSQTSQFNELQTPGFELAKDKIFQLQEVNRKIFDEQAIANAEQLKSRLLDLKDALAQFLERPEEILTGFEDTIKSAKDNLDNLQRDIYGTTPLQEHQQRKQEIEADVNQQVQSLQQQQETINQLLSNADQLNTDSVIKELEKQLEQGEFSEENKQIIESQLDELRNLSGDLTNGEIVERLREIKGNSQVTAEKLREELPRLQIALNRQFLGEQQRRINDARLGAMPEQDIFDRARKDDFRRAVESDRILRDTDISPQEKRIQLEELAKSTSTLYNELQPLEQSFATFFDNVTKGAESLGEAFANMAKSIIDNLKKIAVEALSGKIFKLLFGSLIGGIGSGQGLVSLFTSSSFGLAEGVSLDSGFSGSGSNLTGGFSGGTTPALFAEGGVVDRPTNAVIGEAGYPEAVIPMKQGSVPVEIDSEQIRGGDNYNINISFNDPVVRDDSDLERISNIVDQKIRSQLINQKRPGGVLSR